MKRLAIVVWLGLAAAAEAGPWPAGKGHFYAKAGLSRLRSTTLAAPDGTRFEIPRFTKDEISFYGAYGLTNRITGIVSVPAYRSSDLDDFGSESGFGDVQAGLQFQLGQRGPWLFAVRGMVQAPTGDETRAEGILPTGSGVWEGEAVLGAGRSFAQGKIYGFAEAGHQVRGGGLNDGLSYAVQVGWNIRPRITLAGNIRGIEPYSNDAPREARGSPVGLSDRVTYLSYGPTVILGLGRGAAVQIDVDGASRARNLADGTTVRVGLSLSR